MKNNKLYRQFFIGPMTKNTVDSVISFNREKGEIFGLIPSRRQVECQTLGGGYVNKWNTKDFKSYVKNTLVLRDHAGPAQGLIEDDGILSLREDILSGIKFIHIDPWKNVKSIDDAILQTANLIRYCLSIDEDCNFEIGTESAIRQYSDNELNKFIIGLKNNIGELFKKVIYCVVQSGTQILETSNIGIFDFELSSKMCKIIHDNGLLSKEHNSDYLKIEEIQERIAAGVDSLNIAPEFGVLETLTVLDMLSVDNKLYQSFIDICYTSNKWKKWVKKPPTKLEATKICGHYLFSTNEFKEIKKNLGNSDFDTNIQKELYNNLNRLLKVY